MAAAVREGVIDCVINGRPRADFINVLVKQFGDGNNPGAARSRAVTLTRTEIMHTLNTGAIETYASEGVHFLEWDAEPDACGECLELASHNGGIYPINEYPGAIAHPRCRCVPIPVEDDDPRVAGMSGGKTAAKYRGKIPGEKGIDISGESGIIEEEVSKEKPITPITDGAINATDVHETIELENYIDFNRIGSNSFSDEVKEKLYQHERIISGNKYETGILYDSAGNKLFSVKGTKDEVKFTSTQISQMKNGILTHNHPNGTVFSVADINMLHRGQLSEIRACNANGVYIMRSAGNWNDDMQDYTNIESAYQQAMNDAGEKYRELAAKEGKSIIYYLDRMDEDGMKLFAERYGLEFKWEAKK